jgi:large subunit ribosomal protein L6
MIAEKYSDNVVLPKGVTATCSGKTLKVKGPKGEVTKVFIDPRIVTKTEDGKVIFDIDGYGKREKTLLGTYVSHTKNMIKGVTEGHEYDMKICSGHFPMNVTVGSGQFQVKNYLGEKVPRILTLKKDVEVKVDGDKVHISGIDLENVSQTAAKIEILTRRSKFDRRVFQDGIYIVNKDGKQVA